MGEIFIPT